MKVLPYPYVINVAGDGTGATRRSDSVRLPVCNPVSGLVLQTPDFCISQADKQRCGEYYRTIKGRPGYHKCPYGFASYISPIHPDIIHTSVRIQGFSDSTRALRRELGPFSPVIPKEDFEQSLQKCAVLEGSLSDREHRRARVSAQREETEQYRNLAKFTLHEIRQLNAQVGSSLEILRAELQKPASEPSLAIEKPLRTASAASQLMSIRLRVFDLETNPDLLTLGANHRIAVYKKFEKAAHCLIAMSHSRRVRVRLGGSSVSKIFAHDLVEILPFVLIENAIKYSPPDQTVEVIFDERPGTLDVTIKSVGPRLLPGEEKRVFIKGFRGENARKTSTGESHGYGLYLAHTICEAHDIMLSVRSDDDFSFEYGGVDHCQFIASLRFKTVG